MMNNCLYCYKELSAEENDFHKICSRKFFGSEVPPIVDMELNDIIQMAVKNLSNRISVTGVQPKLSIDFEKKGGNKNRLTLVGLWGRYILKPPSAVYPEIAEIEDVTMHMARELKIVTADHSLVRLKSGELAYITKRFDRKDDGSKLAVEDMAQLSGTLTESKYRGSMEKIGKIIHKYSSNPGIDVINFFEVTLFCYLTGNSDMHLKNFSLIIEENDEIALSPAYDLLSTKLLLTEDKEDLALNLNGKKNNFSKKDFNLFASNLKIEPKAIEKIYIRFEESIPLMNNWIQQSFLSEKTKEAYQALLTSRRNILQ